MKRNGHQAAGEERETLVIKEMASDNGAERDSPKMGSCSFLSFTFVASLSNVSGALSSETKAVYVQVMD